ncbi:MAG TPA: hypothetical protein VGL42_08050 [Opitutaceae bacterium]|jgi:hypothetical protein
MNTRLRTPLAFLTGLALSGSLWAQSNDFRHGGMIAGSEAPYRFPWFKAALAVVVIVAAVAYLRRRRKGPPAA